MNKFTVWSNSLVPLTVTQGDPESMSSTLVLIPSTGANITHSASYELIGGKMVADLSFTSPTVTSDTVYEYYITENIPDEPPLIYPDPSICSNGNCELPTMTVCVFGETS